MMERVNGSQVSIKELEALMGIHFHSAGDRHGPVCLQCVCLERQQPGRHGEDL